MATSPFNADAADGDTVSRVRSMAIRSLRRMYRFDQRIFAFRLRRDGDEDRLEGVSRRYTAIVLIGLATESAAVVADVLHGSSAGALCDQLLDDVDGVTNLGDVALTLWASRVLNHPDAERALRRMLMLDAVAGDHPTVEVAWALTALSVGRDCPGDKPHAEAIAERLMTSFCPRSALFPHWPRGVARPWLRAHVSCFADWVYPVQALSHYHSLTGHQRALDMASASASHMCRMQGADGQWWWHFDVRTGRVVEGYPVYSVHQDSMAPMALLALKHASGSDHQDAIDRGFAWLLHAPEIGGSLVDEAHDVIWRKVARREPGKASRALQAVASRLNASLRVPLVGSVFAPRAIDYETRPYHMGWILHAFPPHNVSASGAV